MVLLQIKDPLELFLKGREFLHCSGFLTHRDRSKAVVSDVLTQTLRIMMQMRATNYYTVYCSITELP